MGIFQSFSCWGGGIIKNLCQIFNWHGTKFKNAIRPPLNVNICLEASFSQSLLTNYCIQQNAENFNTLSSYFPLHDWVFLNIFEQEHLNTDFSK